jgi:hypothetical protein
MTAAAHGGLPVTASAFLALLYSNIFGAASACYGLIAPVRKWTYVSCYVS